MLMERSVDVERKLCRSWLDSVSLDWSSDGVLLVVDGCESQVQVPPGLRAQRDTWTPLMDVLKQDRPRVTDEQLARSRQVPDRGALEWSPESGLHAELRQPLPAHPAGTKLVGRALTMRYLPLRPDIDAATKQIAKEGDWDFQYNVRAGEDANPGDVIVVELGGAVDRATFLGDVTGIGMKQRGVRGVVVDGGIRDLNEFLVDEGFSDLLRQRPRLGDGRPGRGRVERTDPDRARLGAAGRCRGW
jgi:hypothetical protein